MLHLTFIPPYDCDVIVVGGGPAGASAAIHAARSGLSVALLDQHCFPRDKVCGDFVGPVALIELRRLGVTQFPEFRETNMIHSAAVHLDGKPLITSLMPDVPGMPSHGVVVPRKTLDAWTIQAARAAGVRVYEGYRAKSYALDANGVTVSAQGADGMRQWRARLLVGADGSNSVIARQMHRRPVSSHKRIIAVRTYYEGVAGPTDQADLYFSADSFPGYY
jgi:menaquinone-9 beta-reductase